jgi:hypothetical protein
VASRRSGESRLIPPPEHKDTWENTMSATIAANRGKGVWGLHARIMCLTKGQGGPTQRGDGRIPFPNTGGIAVSRYALPASLHRPAQALRQRHSETLDLDLSNVLEPR